MRSSNIISYEEAVERLGSIDCEIHEDGFRRISDEKGFIDSTTFYTHFLRSLIPSISTQLADAIFRGFDTRRRKKLSLKDFMCALGVILRGTTEERLKLLFKMYQTGRKNTIDPRDIETYLMEMSKGKWPTENSRKREIYSVKAIQSAIKDLLNATNTKETMEDGTLKSVSMSFEEFQENFAETTSVFAWMSELEKQILCSSGRTMPDILRPSPSTETLTRLSRGKCLKCNTERESHTRNCVKCGRSYCGTCKKIVMKKLASRTWKCKIHENENQDDEKFDLKKLKVTVPSAEVRCLVELSKFSETQVSELQRAFKTLRTQSVTGDVDFETLREKFCPPMTEVLLRRFFETLDKDESGTISLREFVLGLSICCAGTFEI